MSAPRVARSTLIVLISLAPVSTRAQSPAAPALPPGVKTASVEAKSLGRTLKYNIAFPEGYDSSDRRYPVLYLLHGYSGNYHNWARHGAAAAARGLDLIVVMPDGGNSWYVNWESVDDGQKQAWEDYFVKDLIPHVDTTYRTIAAREGRAINGLSMGGYGALTLGLRHPDLFCSAGSHSGAIGFAQWNIDGMRKKDDPAKAKNARKPSETPNPAIGVDDFDSQAERTPKGHPFASEKTAEAHDPFQLVRNVPKEKLPHLYIDCGTEDSLLSSSRDFARLLLELKVPFTYAESAGGHNGAYWSREIGTSMAVQRQILTRSLAAAPKAHSSEPKATGN